MRPFFIYLRCGMESLELTSCCTELGVSLFENAKVGTRARDELPLLKRLRDKAEARLRGIAHLRSSAGDPHDSDEDLDLIGENARRKTSAVSSPANMMSGVPSPISFPTQPAPLRPFEQTMNGPVLFNNPPQSYPLLSPNTHPLQPHPPPSAFPIGRSNPPSQPSFPTTLDDAIAARPVWSNDPNAGDYASWSADPTVGFGGLFSNTGSSTNEIGGMMEPNWNLDFDAVSSFLVWADLAALWRLRLLSLVHAGDWT